MDQTKIENELFNYTHAQESMSFCDALKAVKEKITKRGNLPHVTTEEQLKIVDQLSMFPLGRFILERRGANGFWTDYMISHPIQGKLSGLNIDGIPFTPLESWFLNECPIVVAHQERFKIFQELNQKLIKNNCVLASIPCGLMRDLITLDYSSLNNFKLIGIDIDLESLFLADQLAKKHNINNIELIQRNAWELEFYEEFDVITSSGLNVYEADPKKVLDLYRQFFTAIKPGGHLIISVLTHPPSDTDEVDWDIDKISDKTLLMDRILHKDILEIKWRNFRSASNIKKEFEEVGFSEISVYFDKCRIFPTILAKKPEKTVSGV